MTDIQDQPTGSLAETLLDMHHISLSACIDMLEITAFLTDGYFNRPDHATTWDTRKVEIKAHGISVDGDTVEEATNAWIKAATRQSVIVEEIRYASAVVMGQCGEVHQDTMRDACETILGPNYFANPADPLACQIYSAAQGTLQTLDTAA